VWEGETNLMKYFVGWNADVRRKIGRNGCPFSVGWDDVYWQSWVELVGQSNLSHRCRSERPWMVSKLLLVVREVDEAIRRNYRMRDKAGGARVPCDLFSNPIVTERPQCS
jgi:hypothetical protein